MKSLNKLVALCLVLVLTALATQTNAQIAAEIPASYDVSANGSFQYSVPLRLPPGIKNMIPSLAINYNSQGGNGMLGVGWSLSGISAITRGYKDVFHDLELKEVDFNDDVLFLDGQRLTLDNNTGKYLTEIKNFAEIISYNAGFKIEYPNGIKYEYGITTNARMLAQGKSDILMWAVNKIEDQYGNFINFEYYNNQNDGDYRISKITYGENSNTNQGIPVEINFNYTTSRNDKNIGWLAGSKVTANVVLESIVVNFSNNAEATRYIFTYDFSDLTRLTKIEEKRNGTTLLPAININWGTISPSVNAPTPISCSSSITGSIKTIGDFNGDGAMDFIEINNTTSYVYMNDGFGNFSMNPNANTPVISQFYKYWDLTSRRYRTSSPNPRGPYKSGTQFDYNGDGKDDIIVIEMYNAGQYPGYPTPIVVSNPWYEVWLYKANGTNTVFDPGVKLYSKTSPSTQSWNTAFNSLTHIQGGDFDGDGKSELLIIHPYNFASANAAADYEFIIVGDEYNNGHQIYHFSDGHIDGTMVFDYDGDGKDEFLVTHQYGSPLGDRSVLFGLDFHYTNTTSSNSTSFKPILNQSSNHWPVDRYNPGVVPNTWAKNWFGDFNGDGKDDILFWGVSSSTNTWTLTYSNGLYDIYNNSGNPLTSNSGSSNWPLTGLLTASVNGPGPAGSNYSLHIADFNGDGLDDILQLTLISGSNPYTQYDIYYSKGTMNFSHETGTVPVGPSYDDINIGDFNGDGQADILGWNTATNNSTYFLVTFYENNNSLKVRSIEHAGKIINIGYDYLTHDNYYQSITSPSLDYLPNRRPIKVVKTISDNGSLYNNYFYSGLLIHKYGLGSRGFAQFIQNNVSGQNFYQKFENTGLFPYLKESQQFDPYGNQSFGTKTYYRQVDFNAGYSHILVNYDSVTINNITAEITKKSIHPGLVASGSVFYEFGKMASIETRVTDLNNNNDRYSSVSYDYGSNWAFNKGRPEKVTEYSEIDPNGLNGITKQTFYTYDRGDVKTIQSNYNKPIKTTTTNYYDQDFGNLVQTDIDAGGLQTIRNTFEYSQDGKFLTKEIDPEGYSTNFSYGTQPLVACWGNVIQKTNKQQLITTYEYDDINRQTKMVDHSHTTLTASGNVTYTTSYEKLGFSPYTSGLTNAKYIALTTNNDDISFSATITDLYGRTIREVSSDHNGNPLYKDYTFNNIGLLSISTNLRRGAPIQTTYEYDPYNRLKIETTGSGGALVTTDYDYSTGLLQKTTINTNSGKSRTSVTCGSTLRKIYGNNDNIEYTYHGNGTPAKIITNGLLSENKLDLYDRLKQNVQPNAGTTTYEYDHFGRVSKEYLSTRVTYEYTYDRLGRVLTKLESGKTIPYTYTYYPAGAGPGLDGQLIEETAPNVSGTYPASYSIKYHYKSTGELEWKEENSAFPSLAFPPHSSAKNNTHYTYYNNGKLKEYIFYNDISVKYSYNSAGNINLSETQGVPNGLSHRLVETWNRDPYGHLTGTYVYNDDKVSPKVIYDATYSYDGFGSPTGSHVDNKNNTVSSPASLVPIIDREYNVDPATGNMLSRTDNMKTPANIENFTYDVDFDRLTRVQYSGTALPTPPIPPLTDLEMTYADNGNILKKTDVTTSTYNWKYTDYALNTLPEPATSATPYEVPICTLYTDHYPFGKIKKVFEHTKNDVWFTYGAGDERIKAEYYDASITPEVLEQTKYYGENYEMIVDKTGSVTELFYIWQGGNLVSLLRIISPPGATSYTTSTVETFYPIFDHLGSIIYFLDDKGDRLTNNGIVEERSYDAWGRLRDPNTFVPYRSGSFPTNFITDRGYTGAEVIRLGSWNNNIINLGGRLYDPLSGRMFSPDPAIADPNNSQDYNKYTYARNNPLKYTDPSGNMPVLAVIAIGAAMGGLINTASNAGNIHTFGDGLKYFGVGAAAGAAGAGIGAAIVGPAGAGVSAYTDIVASAAGGFGGGFVGAAGNAWIGGASFMEGLGNGFTNAVIGGITGAAMDLLSESVTSYPYSSYNEGLGGPEEGDVFGVNKESLYRNQYGSKDVISLEEFKARYANCTEQEIIGGEMKVLGQSYPNKMNNGGGFVTLPNKREADMVHFFVVGRAGEFKGTMNEIKQMFSAPKSAFYPQDLYSNKLGVNFFKSYASLLMRNPKMISQYIFNYLSNPKVINFNISSFFSTATGVRFSAN